jgi:tetratricopeptide (TPR) repeat protein
MSQSGSSVDRLSRLLPLLQAEPENLPLHRECVDLAMRGGEFPRALEFIDARLQRHPTEPESLFARSNALIGLQRFEDAIVVLKSLEEQGVAPAAVMQNLVTCHFALRQYEHVRAYGERLIAAGEQSPDLWQLTILALHHLGDMDAAVKLAEQCTQAATTHARLAGTCAMVFLDVSEAGKAGKFAALALAQYPDSVDGLVVQATLAMNEFENRQAFEQYSRVLQLAPQNARAWLGLGLLAMLSQDFARARELLGRALELMPQHVGSWHAMAWTHLAAGDTAGAERHFAHALELDRNFAESHGAMAAMLAIRGEREAAERELEIAERLDPSGLSSQFARAMLIGNAQGPEAARDYVQQAILAAAPRLGGGGKPAALLRKLASARPPQRRGN